MSTISVKAHFAAGHRILNLSGPGSKCRNIHGHNFTVLWVFEQAPDLEFGMLKQVLRELVKDRFDHGFVLDQRDDFCQYLNANMLKSYKLNGPPTTEAMAEEIARLSIERVTLPWNAWQHRPATEDDKDPTPPIYPDARLVAVRLDEGPENSATWTQGRPGDPRGWGTGTILSGLAQGLGLTGPING